MEWFGYTLNQTSDPIKDMMRPDYKEPEVQGKNLSSDIPTHQKQPKPFSEQIKELDVYIGIADGYAYRSYNRLIKMRRKACFKPVGPTDMFRYPGCTSMETGWFLSDPALCCETWYQTEPRYPQPTSEYSRFVEHALKADKLFKI